MEGGREERGKENGWREGDGEKGGRGGGSEVIQEVGGCSEGFSAK